MDMQNRRPIAGTSAVIAGVLGLIGFAFLILFYVVEAPTLFAEGETTSPLFGTLNDATYVLVGLLLLPAALMLYRRAQPANRIAAAAGLICGIFGLVPMAITQALYVPRIISTEQQGPIISAIFGVIGLWMILASVTNRSSGGLPSRLSWLGIGIGVCMIILTATFFVGGGASFASNPQAGAPPLPTIIGFAIGGLASSIGWPIWAIWLGMNLLREAKQ